MITTNLMDMKSIIREYYKQLYAYKFDNLDEVNQVLEMHQLPKFTPGETGNQNKSLFLNDTKSTIKNFLKEKTPDPDRFIGGFYQTFKGK